MRREFVKLIVQEIKTLRKFAKEQKWGLYSHQLTTVSSKAEMALELGIITFNQWRRIINLIYAYKG